MYRFQGVPDGSCALRNSCRRLARKVSGIVVFAVTWSGRPDMAVPQFTRRHARDRSYRTEHGSALPPDRRRGPDRSGRRRLAAGSAGFSPPALAGEWSLDAVLAAETTESTPCDSQRLACILVAGVYAGGPFDPLPGYFLHLFLSEMLCARLLFQCVADSVPAKKNRLRFSESGLSEARSRQKKTGCVSLNLVFQRPAAGKKKP